VVPGSEDMLTDQQQCVGIMVANQLNVAFALGLRFSITQQTD